MRIKLSATFNGKCDICKRKSIVFTVGDEDSKKVVTICKKCSEKLASLQSSDVIEKYGKEDYKAFEGGLRLERKNLAG